MAKRANPPPLTRALVQVNLPVIGCTGLLLGATWVGHRHKKTHSTKTISCAEAKLRRALGKRELSVDWRKRALWDVECVTTVMLMEIAPYNRS